MVNCNCDYVMRRSRVQHLTAPTIFIEATSVV